MRKTLLVITILLFVFVLAGCEKEIEVTPGIIDVIYDNPRYKDGNFYIDTYITNGLYEDVDIAVIEFGIYTDDEVYEIASAGFNIDETIKSGSYVSIELEFTDSYIFYTKDQVTDLGYDVKDVVLFFWIEQ